MLLQAKLDDMYCKRAQGAFVRSRAKWIEEGEENTSYFSSLEKRRQGNKAVSSSLIKGVECKDVKTIEKEVFIFFLETSTHLCTLTLILPSFWIELRISYPKLMMLLKNFVSLI